ncbi:uncharacterized protein LOC111892973 [Lactuca sativa]|uniref:Uncharacterized protein n=1 Tax=Lactuca sativa TaxID=4236 RepID=A0A9R1UCF8_LACSA|nr:uncharacterized protein LOC111892973 [Lactuca sativa]KAJ0184557.1 hypothetical protein LSAT_V11C900501880 [Lactuca sativa]
MDEDFVRDSRKGKAKLEEEEEDPDPNPNQNPDSLLTLPIPKSYSNFEEDVVYLKIVGPQRNYEEVTIDTPEEVKKIQFRFRNKEFNRILGIDDERIINIQSVSGATIGILSDTAAKIHRHLYLELLGTADEIKIAELLITDVITEGYVKPFVPRALMPTHICHHATPILFTQVIPFLGFSDSNLLKMESKSNTWIEVDTYPPDEERIMERMVNIYGQGLDVTKAIMMIDSWVSEFETKFRVKSEVVIEEVESDEESEKMEEDEKQKDCEEDDYGMKEGDDEVGN